MLTDPSFDVGSPADRAASSALPSPDASSPDSTPLPLEPAVLVEQINRFCERHGIKRLTAVFSVEVADQLVSAIGAMRQTVSFVLAAEPRKAPTVDTLEIGWLRSDGRVERCPVAMGDLILVFGEAEAFGFKACQVVIGPWRQTCRLRHALRIYDANIIMAGAGRQNLARRQ